MTNRDPQTGKFLPGNSANPGGRPKQEFSIAAVLRAELQARPNVIKRWVDLAESENDDVALRALISLANRVEGMPKQATELTGKDGEAMLVRYVEGPE